MIAEPCEACRNAEGRAEAKYSSIMWNSNEPWAYNLEESEKEHHILIASLRSQLEEALASLRSLLNEFDSKAPKIPFSQFLFNLQEAHRILAEKPTGTKPSVDNGPRERPARPEGGD